MLSPVTLLTVALSFAAGAAAFGGGGFESKEVLKLTKSSFDEQVAQEKVTAVKFYAPWCGHCKKLAPTWKELAAAYKGNEDVQVAHIDCTKNATICKAAGVSGYPRLILYFNGQQHATYRGPRTLESLKVFIDAAVKELLSAESAEL